MTTATGGTAADDDALTTEVEEEPVARAPREPSASRVRVAPGLARALFLGLAGVALLALVAAAFIVFVWTPPSTVTLLFVTLGVVALVVVAEIVLLLLARPEKA